MIIFWLTLLLLLFVMKIIVMQLFLFANQYKTGLLKRYDYFLLILLEEEGAQFQPMVKIT